MWSALSFVVLWAFMEKDWLLSLPTFRDQFLRSALMRDVAWTGFEPFVGLLILAGAVVAFVFRRKGDHAASIISLFGGVILFVSLALPFVTPRIEPYTQGAALDFYESKVGEDVYIQPLDFKTYAHLFYQRRPYQLSGASKRMSDAEFRNWLLEGEVDRPAFFVCKVHQSGTWREHPNLHEMYEEGGFVFFKRSP